MRKIVTLGILIAFCVVSSITAAQETESARLRVTQIFAGVGTFFLDEAVFAADLNYPFTSDYVAVAPGSHVLAVARDDDGLDGAVPTEIDLAAGHDYVAAAINTNDDFTEFDVVLIDETAATAELGEDYPGNVNLVIHAVAGAPALNAYVDDELVIEGLAFGDYAVFESPLPDFHVRVTPADDPATIIWESDFSGQARTYVLTAAVGIFPDWFNIVCTTSSDLLIVDYLAALHGQPANYFDSFYEALAASDVLDTLSGDGPFTVFAPTDAAFAALPDSIRNDPQAMALLRYHIVADRIPPDALLDHESLLTLQGNSLALSFPEGEYWRINDTAQVIDDTRLPNGILYEIDAVLLPK